MNSARRSDPLFDRDGWWDPNCDAFRSLRSVTEFRWNLLRRWIPEGFAGLTVADLGCGGGLLAVPLARAGARVLAIDVARGALAALQRQGVPGLQPVAGDLCAAPLADASADLVLLADVLEHVDAGAVGEAARVLRLGGRCFVNTIARTLRSRFLAITAAEGLGFIPKGTHQWSRFVQPEELDAQATEAGLRLVARTGESPDCWKSLRSRTIVLRTSHDLSVGYAVLFEKVLR